MRTQALTTTVRGVRLVAAAPDARYRRYHTDICPHPEETTIGRAVLVKRPARYAPEGTLLCAAYMEWQIDGRRVDPCLYFLRSILRDGSDAHVSGKGRWDLIEEMIPSDDPELLALQAELAALDAAWLASHTAEIVAEDRRSNVQARSAVHDEAVRDPAAAWTALECLECGAVFTTPGSVEPGGMGCRRCQ